LIFYIFALLDALEEELEAVEEHQCLYPKSGLWIPLAHLRPYCFGSSIECSMGCRKGTPQSVVASAQ
jgi:hypothetical protein